MSAMDQDQVKTRIEEIYSMTSPSIEEIKELLMLEYEIEIIV